MTVAKKRYTMLINIDRCVGCYACQVTCKSEYNLPLGVYRCRVKTYSSGKYPRIQKIFIPHICNHCNSPPCILTCEENALYKNRDGIVLLNNEKCTGCQQCYDACPYKAIIMNPYNGTAEKCDFCYERRTLKGLPPVCVESCMGKAIFFGDVNNSANNIRNAITEANLKVVYSEKETGPSVFYTTKRELNNTSLTNYKIPDSYLSNKMNSYDISSNEKEINMVYSSDAMCPSECGIKVHVEGGVAKKIYGNPHTLISNGSLCAKGASGLQMTYSPHRIKTPLLRIGERGDDNWKEISWDQASDYMSKKLIALKRDYGPESVLLDCGDVTDREAYYRLFHAFGTPNTFNHGSICDPNRRWGQRLMTGDERPLPDLQRPFLCRNDDGELFLKNNHDIKLLINIGTNPFVATRFNYMSSGIPAAREENNCYYVVIDPSYTNSASHADMWLPIIPGTDPNLLAAMLFFIIKNDSPDNDDKKYIDHKFIRNYTNGWHEFKETFLSYSKKKDKANNLYFFTTEWASEKTGIPEEDIRNISHLFGIIKPAAIEIGMHGSSHHHNGDITSILMTALCLITGNLDCPGGLVFIDSQKAKKGIKSAGQSLLDRLVSRKINGKVVFGKLSDLHKDFFGDYPAAWKGVLSDIPDKIRDGIELSHGPFKGLNYPVKAFISRAGNPIITAGNTKDWIDAFTTKDTHDNYKLEFFVFIDTHITDTGKYADLILPEAGFLERMGVSDVFTMSPEIAIRDQVIKPLHKSKTPFEIMSVLSNALIKNGDSEMRKEDFNYQGEEDFINEILSEAPGYHNVGNPLPYPDLPEGCLILGIPVNPRAIWGKSVIKEGVLLTVEWLRKNNGVAVWPASYYRYKKHDGTPSGIYPKTGSRKFEFKFSYLEKINNKFGVNYPTVFYWSDCLWNPKNSLYDNVVKEYPFQLISGRGHYAMTMTGVCPFLTETETECMKPLNSEFYYNTPENKKLLGIFGLPDKRQICFKEDSLSIPVLAINSNDGNELKLANGDLVYLESPHKDRLKGKIYLTEEIRPGIIKMIFGPGGQNASGTGILSAIAEYTQNINRLVDPKNVTPFTGMSGFGDIMVKIIKI